MNQRCVACILLLIGILCGCCRRDSISSSCSLFYNPYMQKLVVYDEVSKAVSLYDTTKNQFQFQVDGRDDLFIDGNSITNEFRVICVNQSDISELYEFDKGEGVFPVGLIGEKLYFIHAFYGQYGEEKTEKRCIGVLDLQSSKLNDFRHVTGLIDYGAANEEYLYYTIYDEIKESYSLLRVDRNDIDDEPIIIREDMSCGGVILEQDKLFHMDGQYLLCEQDRYKKEAVNIISCGSLIQFYIDRDGMLCVRVTNTETKAVYEESDVCGIRLVEGGILICKLTGVIRYET